MFLRERNRAGASSGVGGRALLSMYIFRERDAKRERETRDVAAVVARDVRSAPIRVKAEREEKGRERKKEKLSRWKRKKSISSSLLLLLLSRLLDVRRRERREKKKPIDG